MWCDLVSFGVALEGLCDVSRCLCLAGLDLVHGVDCVVEAEVDEVGEVWLWSRACGGDVGLLQFSGLCTTR